MAAVAVRRPFAADSDMALAALIQACQPRKPKADQELKTRVLLPYFTAEDEVTHLKSKRQANTPGRADRAGQVKAKRPKASKQAPAAPVALSVSRKVAPIPKPAAATTPSVAIKVLAKDAHWAGPSSFISPKPEALPKPSLSLLRKAATQS